MGACKNSFEVQLRSFVGDKNAKLPMQEKSK